MKKSGTTHRLMAMAATLAAALCLLAGCGDASVGDHSTAVGGSCDYHSDCDDFCLTDWPGGMCTILCDDDSACPRDSACIDKEHGVCLMECSADRDCPGGYECDDEDRRGHPGKRDVCVED